jgi:hypothetical protein
VIGFTVQHGHVAQIVLEAHGKNPELIRKAFGPKTDELIGVMRSPRARQVAFGDSISIGRSKSGVAEPWKSAFARFGRLPEVQAIQLQHVSRSYFEPARQTAKDLGLKTELGLALCFDIHVQNGSVRPTAREQIRREVAAHPIHKERELRVIVANAVADASRPQFRQDVLSRKLTLATGAGKVHGATYVLRNWGLDASPLPA